MKVTPEGKMMLVTSMAAAHPVLPPSTINHLVNQGCELLEDYSRDRVVISFPKIFTTDETMALCDVAARMSLDPAIGHDKQNNTNNLILRKKHKVNV